MNRPRVFISSVSQEFRSLRQIVEATARDVGYEPVTQDNFPPGHGELKAWLVRQINACEGLIQLAGVAYGMEPPQPDPEFGRVSYTQFEFLHARRKGIKTWLVQVGDECRRDNPPEALDLPPPGYPDPAGWQRQRARLQQDYLRRIRQDNHLSLAARNEHELTRLIARLRSDVAEHIAEQRRIARRKAWWTGIAMVASLATLALIGYQGWRGQAMDDAAQADYRATGWTSLAAATRLAPAAGNAASPWTLQGTAFLAGPPASLTEVDIDFLSPLATGSTPIKPYTIDLDRTRVADAHPFRITAAALPAKLTVCLTRPHPVLGTPWRVVQQYTAGPPTTLADEHHVRFTETAPVRAAPASSLACS